MKRAGGVGSGLFRASAQIASACILCGCIARAPNSPKASVSQEPPPTELRQAQTLLDDARRAQAAEHKSAAVDAAARALALLKNGGVVSHADLMIIAYTYVDLARVLMQASQPETARSAIASALSLLKPGSKPDDAGISYAQQALGDLSLQEHDPATALTAFSTALAAVARHEPDWVPRQIMVLRDLAAAQVELDRPADAVATWERALYLDEHFSDAESPRYHIILSLVTGYAKAGDSRAAELFARHRGFERVMNLPAATFEYRTPCFTSCGKPAPAAAPTLGALPVGSVSTATVSNPSQVVAGMRAGFRACFQASSAHRGAVRIRLTVDKGGAVSGASGLTLGLPATLTDCLLARASHATFDPPAGGSATVVIPLALY